MRKQMNGKSLKLGVVLAAAVAMLALAGTGAEAGEKAYLGVYMQELTKDVREGLDIKTERGVLISGVAEDSSAEAAGIEDGDVIVEFDGKDVDSADELQELVADMDPGDKVKIVLIRDGERKTIELELGERPADFMRSFSHGDFDFHFDGDSFRGLGRHMKDDWFTLAESIGRPRLGVHVTDLGEDLAEYFDTDAESGVLVLEVSDETVAAEAGVKAGDVIQKIGDEDVTTPGELRRSLRDFEEGDEFAIEVLRKGKKRTLDATMSEDSHAFRIHHNRGPRVREHFRAPRVRIERDRINDDVREELEELKRELKELKKELKKRG